MQIALRPKWLHITGASAEESRTACSSERTVRPFRRRLLLTKNDLLRDAVNYYLAAQEDLPGSRRAIAKGIESKVDALDEKVETMAAALNAFIDRVTRKREG
jgi:hypothetical protein